MLPILISGTAIGIAFIDYAINPKYSGKPAPLSLTITAATWVFVVLTKI